MHAHLGVAAARAREAVASFLARGRVARLAACILVSAAAVVWLGALVVFLRILSVAVLVAASAWLAWLVLRVWRRPDRAAENGFPSLLLHARALRPGRAATRPVEEVEAGETGSELADIRDAVAALSGDLVGWQERLNHDVERFQRELASKIDALHELMGRVATHEETPPRRTQPSDSDVRAPVEPDLEAVLDEIEADLRLEKIEEREQILAEREERLDRRERDIAALVSETQARLR